MNAYSPIGKSGTSVAGSILQNSLLGGYWVDAQSAEFDAVRYQLHAATSHLGVLDKLTIWKINNLDLQYKYERKSSGLLRLTGFINVDQLSPENTLEHVNARGFTFDPNKQRGLSFPTGIINSIPEYSIGTEVCFVFYEMAIGRAFVYDRNVQQAVIPQGYDSLYLSPKPLDRNRDGKFSLHEYQLAATFDKRESRNYHHEYFLADMNQVFPKYILRFKLQRPSNSPLLAADQLLSLASTTTDVQFIDPITLQPMGGPSNTGNLTPLNMTASLSSPMSKTAISSPLSTSHALDKQRQLSVEKVYAQAVDEMGYLDNDPAVLSKDTWLCRQLSSIEDKLREINLNYVDVLEAIESAANAAKQKLQDTMREKLELFLGMEIELRRQREQMAFLNETAASELKKYQQGIADAHGNDPLRRKLMLQFLRLWKQHNLVRNSLSRAKPHELQALNTIHGDVRVQPEIRLFTDPFFSANDKKQTSTSSGADGRGPTSAVGASSAGKAGSILSGSQYLQQLSARARVVDSFAPGLVPLGQSLLPTQVQSAIDQEIETLQQLVLNEAVSGVFRLPQSIAQSVIAGAAPPLPLHAALDWLRSEKQESDQIDNLNHGGPDLTDKNAVNNIQLAFQAASLSTNNFKEESVQRKAFEAAFPYALGAEPSDGRGNASHLHDSANDHVADVMPEEDDKTVLSEAPSLAPSVPSLHLPPQRTRKSVSETQPQSASQNLQNKTETPTKQQRQALAEKTVPSPDVDESAQDESTIDIDTNVAMTIQSLQSAAAQHHRQHRLSDIGLRKQKQLQARLPAGSDQAAFAVLQSSEILRDNEIAGLYYCLPFFSKPPTLKLLYSLNTHRRSLEEIFNRTIKNRNPVLLLIRSGEFRFGAYLSHAPVPTSQWSGSPSCFLFSLTFDLKIPFHARQVLGEFGVQEPMALFATGERIYLGNGDLSIDDQLQSGTTELENSFGIGLKPHSNEALCLLAGTPVFAIDDLEVFTIIA